MENYKFSTLEYKRPDLEAHRTQLAQWKAAVGQAESYEALRSLIFEIDRESCELFTQYSIAHIRHTLDTRDEFYEAEINYLQDTLPTLSGDEVALSEAIAASPFRADIEQEFGKQYFVSMDLQKKLFCEANIPLRQQESRLTNEYQKIMARSLPEEVTQGTLEGDIVPGDITFFRLQSTSDNILRAYIANGEVLPVATKSFGAIGVFAIPEMGRFYRHVLIEKNFPHHGAVAFGHFGKALYEVFKYIGVDVDEIGYNQPKGVRYPTENPFA